MNYARVHWILNTIFVAIIILCPDSTTSTYDNQFEDWCPNAECLNSPNCKPCERRFLFIISQGRAGSTTLKNMINLLPNIRIRGETGEVMQKVRKLFDDVRTDGKLRSGAKDFRKAWGHYAYSSNYLMCPAQKMLEALNPPYDKRDRNDDSLTIIGSKEVRLLKDEHLDFLIEHFPCSRFIFNIRSDPEALSKSRKNAFGKDYLENKEDPRPNLFKKYYSKLGPNRAYLMDMVNWSEGQGMQFTVLADWLGFEGCTFNGLFHDNKGAMFVVDHEHKIDVGKNCRYTGRNILQHTNDHFSVI